MTIPPPPITMNMPSGPQDWATAVTGLLSAIVLLVAVLGWRKTRSPVYTLLVIGGGLCVVNEPQADILGLVWHPGPNSHHLFTAFDRPIPVWALFGYVLVYGALPAVLVRMNQRRMAYGRLWMASLGLWAVDLAIEIPLLNKGLYVYYGDQPFSVAGLPLTQLVFNSLAILLITSVVTTLPALFRGVRALLIIPLMPLVQLTSYAVGLPAFWGVNNAMSGWGRWICVGVTLVVGLALIDAANRFLAGVPQVVFATRPAPGSSGSLTPLSGVPQMVSTRWPESAL